MSLRVTHLIGFGGKRAASGACGCTPGYVTGDRTATVTASYSGGLYTGTASTLVNGVTGTNGVIASGNDPGGGEYVRFDFGSGASKKITEAKFYAAGTTSWGTYKWQGSNDASAWTDVGSNFALAGSTGGTALTQLSGNTAGYRYYQLAANPGVAGGSAMREFEFSECDC